MSAEAVAYLDSWGGVILAGDVVNIDPADGGVGDQSWKQVRVFTTTAGGGRMEQDMSRADFAERFVPLVPSAVAQEAYEAGVQAERQRLEGHAIRNGQVYEVVVVAEVLPNPNGPDYESLYRLVRINPEGDTPT